MVQGHKPFLLRGAVSDYEVPRGSKAHAGDARRINFGFVVAVPTHGVLTVSVLVEEAGIEVTGALGIRFHFRCKLARLNIEGAGGPMDAEFTNLQTYLGINTNIKLKSACWNGDNESGFSALAGGIRLHTGTFVSEGEYAYFWSSTLQVTPFAWNRLLSPSYEEMEGGSAFVNAGYSVRYVRDVIN